MLMSNNKHEAAELVFKDYLTGNPGDQRAITLLQSCQFIELFKDWIGNMFQFSLLPA